MGGFAQSDHPEWLGLLTTYGIFLDTSDTAQIMGTATRNLASNGVLFAADLAADIVNETARVPVPFTDALLATSYIHLASLVRYTGANLDEVLKNMSQIVDNPNLAQNATVISAAMTTCFKLHLKVHSRRARLLLSHVIDRAKELSGDGSVDAKERSLFYSRLLTLPQEFQRRVILAPRLPARLHSESLESHGGACTLPEAAVEMVREPLFTTAGAAAQTVSLLTVEERRLSMSNSLARPRHNVPAKAISHPREARESAPAGSLSAIVDGACNVLLTSISLPGQQSTNDHLNRRGKNLLRQDSNMGMNSSCEDSSTHNSCDFASESERLLERRSWKIQSEWPSRKAVSSPKPRVSTSVTSAVLTCARLPEGASDALPLLMRLSLEHPALQDMCPTADLSFEALAKAASQTGATRQDSLNLEPSLTAEHHRPAAHLEIFQRPQSSTTKSFAPARAKTGTVQPAALHSVSSKPRTIHPSTAVEYSTAPTPERTTTDLLDELASAMEESQSQRVQQVSDAHMLRTCASMFETRDSRLGRPSISSQEWQPSAAYSLQHPMPPSFSNCTATANPSNHQVCPTALSTDPAMRIQHAHTALQPTYSSNSLPLWTQGKAHVDYKVSAATSTPESCRPPYKRATTSAILLGKVCQPLESSSHMAPVNVLYPYTVPQLQTYADSAAILQIKQSNGHASASVIATGPFGVWPTDQTHCTLERRHPALAVASECAPSLPAASTLPAPTSTNPFQTEQRCGAKPDWQGGVGMAISPHALNLTHSMSICSPRASEGVLPSSLDSATDSFMIYLPTLPFANPFHSPIKQMATSHPALLDPHQPHRFGETHQLDATASLIEVRCSHCSMISMPLLVASSKLLISAKSARTSRQLIMVGSFVAPASMHLCC